MPSRKILLVDDHPLVREWLANLIDEQDDLQVSGAAGSADEALEQIGRAKPDLAIVDISLNGGSGLDLIKTIRVTHPSVRTIVLSMHEENIYAERAIRAGARGYVMKRESTKRVLTVIRRVLEGKLGVSEEIAARFANNFIDGRAHAGGSIVERLSDRELEVFRMLGQGMDTRQVADSLRISIKTVQAYCARIKEKLNLANATELLREAMRWSDAQAAPLSQNSTQM